MSDDLQVYMYRRIVGGRLSRYVDSSTLGDTVLTYAKRVWNMGGEVRGLRYGENPHQPAALYELREGRNTLADRTLARSGAGRGLGPDRGPDVAGGQTPRQDQSDRRGQRRQHPAVPHGPPRPRPS